MKKKEWLILCIITIIAGLALGGTDLLTRDSIAEQERSALNAARFAVMPEATDFVEEALAEGATLDGLYKATQGEKVVGYVGQATVSGFGGPIVVLLGVDGNQAVTGISVGGSNFAETAGLGTRTKDPEFTDQFKGLTSVPTFGENVDAISGVTVSSTAVTSGAKLIYEYIVAVMNGGDVPVAQKAIPLTAEDQRVITVKGFAGEMDVTVAVNPDGSVQAIDVGGPNFQESPGMGAKTKEPEFTNQFAGKTGPLAFGDGIEAISGATVTSTAVLNAVNQALGFQAEVQQGLVSVTELATPDSTGAVKEVKTTVQGFASEIEITIGVDGNGAITSLKIGGPKFNETEYMGAEVQTNTYRDQFIGKTGPFVYGEGVDAISRATITSNAVLEGINEALGY